MLVAVALQLKIQVAQRRVQAEAVAAATVQKLGLVVQERQTLAAAEVVVVMVVLFMAAMAVQVLSLFAMQTPQVMLFQQQDLQHLQTLVVTKFTDGQEAGALLSNDY
jgi:hypothetical protein